MKAVKSKKRKKFRLTSFIGKCAFLFVLFSMLASVITNQFEIADKKRELEELQSQVVSQTAENEELSLLIESGETEMVERVAREEYGYAAPNERIFIDMSGK